MRVRALTTGAVRQKAGGPGIGHYVHDRWRDDVLPVHAFLVEHPDCLVLFDTGQTARAASPGWFPRWHPFFRLSRFELGDDDEAPKLMRSLGIDPSSVRFVVLSHLHTDHVGTVSAFRGSTVVVGRLEWERATGLRGALRGYLPQRWPAEVTPTLVESAGEPIGPFPASHDLLGDGRLLLVPTPGHTPGHLALLVRGEARSWLLAGDLAHTAAELPEVAPAVADWCTREHVLVLTSHDPAATAHDEAG